MTKNETRFIAGYNLKQGHRIPTVNYNRLLVFKLMNGLFRTLLKRNHALDQSKFCLIKISVITKCERRFELWF